MPLIIPRDLPAYAALSKENVFVMHRERAHTQDIRPLRILILNLMPTKIVTETTTPSLTRHPDPDTDTAPRPRDPDPDTAPRHRHDTLTPDTSRKGVLWPSRGRRGHIFVNY